MILVEEVILKGDPGGRIAGGAGVNRYHGILGEEFDANRQGEEVALDLTTPDQTAGGEDNLVLPAGACEHAVDVEELVVCELDPLPATIFLSPGYPLVFDVSIPTGLHLGMVGDLQELRLVFGVLLPLGVVDAVADGGLVDAGVLPLVYFDPCADLFRI